jgi:CubicO group peptidase (beta-lactamase class C family)
MNLEELALGWQAQARTTPIPGVALAVLNRNETRFNTFGRAQNDFPVTSSTVFEAASLSKLVVAYASLKLCQSGVLELDRPLIEYLPDANLEHDARLGTITTRHVLSHTSGLPNWTPEGTPALTQFLPGEKFSYSGTGFARLQKVIERITDSSLETHLQKTVFEPLKMRDSSFIWQHRWADRAAVGHDQHGASMPKDEPSQPHAAYSLHSTVTDLAILMGKFLHSRITLEMIEPQIDLNDRVAWGLGWGLETCQNGTFFWQWGANPGFRSLMLGSSDSGFGVVVLTNSANGSQLWKPILEGLTGVEHPALAWLEGS